MKIKKELIKNKLFILILFFLLVFATIFIFSIKQKETQGIKDIREIKITAKRFEYSPSEIVLKKGERVKLIIENVDFIHGLHFEDLPGEPGGDLEYIFEVTEVGEFEFHCNRMCGMGHEQMKGKIIVIEN